MSVWQWLIDQAQAWLLILARVSGWVMTVPVLSSSAIPVSVRLGLAGILSILAAEAVLPSQGTVTAGMALFPYILEVVKQWLIGAALGFVGMVLFLAVEMAGQLVDVQMGLSVVNLLNPQSGTPGALMANWQAWLATMVFLALDGHHALLSGLLHSFEWIRLGAAVPVGPSVEVIARSVAVLFILAIQLAAPLLISLFLFDVILAFISRAAPQVNVLFVAMPGKILAGWGMAFVTLPVLVFGISRLMGWINSAVDGLLRALGSG
ncbi:MAG: flagellar biosynthetic protein FliR [Alicyclobacillaceae bacterium]|nr:flagellar biosynthetic protein FliR [Alicyclobacillaceae bacterium]